MDNVTGIVLDIPAKVLGNIKRANDAILTLEQTSKHAAKTIEGNFGIQMPRGVDKFIQAIEKAQGKLNTLKLPTIDTTGLSAAVQELSRAMSTVDRSATTGANRIGKIADAMTKLQTANPNPMLFQNIADGIAKIGNTSQQTIDNVRNLSQIMAQLARDIRTVQQAQSAQNANTASAAQYNKLYKEQAQIMREIMALQNKPQKSSDELDLLTKLKNRYQDIYQEIDKLNRKQQTNASELAKAQAKLRNEMAKRIADPAGAINYAKNAKSLNELQAAYKNLKSVMATVKPDTKEWTAMNTQLEKTRNRIDEIRKKMGEFKSTASGVGDIAGRLARTLAATFSVSAITGYMNKMIQVRAEFELQQTALRAILQNKDEADRIFMQVQQMALQSPFSILQLTTYTKQIAAYRIESEKLVGTTKMLADVSAGLGVDIGRLILAYGQVKAANYLRACLGRGTKVKMFDGTSKNVEDVVVGDMLMGDDEQPRHVNKLYQGEQQMYRVRYKGGEFRCNEHHILTVYDALCDCVSDVFVTEVFNSSLVYRYQGVRRVDGKYEPFFMEVEKDTVDAYYGFSIDGNHRFIIEDNIVTHNTEVRQFTEAGLNIAGELANYFSELQGKMISVGDVMDMITKRMVRFEDVEEVFKRVTSAGGLFYDMQKKQSETLKGQLQRINDAMSIMFNEIGQSNQGVISDMLTTIRSIISNWRVFATTIKVAGGFLGSFYLITKALTVSKWSNALVLGMRQYLTNVKAAITSTGALKTALMSLNFTGVATIAAAIGLAVSAVMELTSSTSALREELERVAGESMADMYSSIYNFKDLAKTATDATKSYKERAEAMEALNRTYKDILPAELLEIENIRKMGEEYTIATNAIREYYTEAAKKKAQEAIANDQEQAWNTLINHLKDGAEYLKRGQAELAIVPVATLKGLIGKTMLELKQELEDGTTDVNNAWERFKQLFADTSGLQLVDNASTRSFRAFFGEYTFTVADFYDDITDIVKRGNEAQEEFDAQYAEGLSKDTKLIIQKYNERLEAVSRFHNALMNYASLQQKGELRNEDGGFTELGRNATQELGAAKAAMNQYLGVLGEAKISWEGLTTATSNNTDALLFFNDVQQRVLGGFLTNVQATATDTSLQAWAQKSQRELQQMGLSDLQKDIIDLAKQSATANGMQISMLDKLKISAETNYASAAKDAKALSEQAIDNINKIQATKTALLEMAKASNKALTDAQAQAQAESMHGNGYTEDELKAQSEYWQQLAKLYGDYEKKKEHAGRQKDIWTPRLNLMQKVNKEYEKLLKYYSKEDAMAKIRSSYGDAVAEAFKGTQWADISKWGTFDAQATVDRLKRLAEVAGKDAKKKILEAAGTIEAEIEIKVKESEIQKAKDELQKNFDNYELTKTLGNLGLNVDLTYMVGGQPMTLPQIRKDIEDKLKVAKATDGQEKLVKTYEDYLRKVADMENKAAVERSNNYNKYLLESMSERVQIELKAQQEIRKIRQDDTLDDFSKSQAVEQAKKKMQEDLTKFDFDQFKSSDVYLDTFKDLEKASKEQLQYVIDRLKELQSATKDLSPIQVKSIAQEIKKAQDALGERTSFTDIGNNLTESIKYAKQRSTLISQQVALQKQLTAEENKLSEAEKKLYDLTVERDAIQDKSSDAWKEANAEVEKQQQTVVDIQNGVEGISTALDGVTKKISKGEQAWANFRGAVSKTRDAIGQANEAIGPIFEGMDSMGLIPDSMRDGFESVSEIIGGIDKALAGLESIDITKPFSVVTGIGKTIGGIFSTIGGIFGMGDKKKERQIQRLQDKIEDLQKAYEKLGVAIEEAYSYDDYNMAYNQSMKNLEEQRKTIQEQMALEEAKKKTDKDNLKEYEDALEQIAEQEKQLRNQFYQDWGSYSKDQLKSASEEWASAWYDAFKETGSGLDALNKKWDDFFENLILNQIASAVVQKRLSKYVYDINALLDQKDLSEAERAKRMKEIWDRAQNESSVLDNELQNLMEYLGIKGGQADLLLSDLQKGIQNITEPQAAAIEAYLNSMRFAVFEQNNILTDMLTAIQAQYGSSTDNPILSEVKAIRSLVASIDERLGKVIVSRNSGANSYIMKVG